MAADFSPFNSGFSSLTVLYLNAISASVPPVELPVELASRLRAASDLDLLNAYVNERKRDPAMAAALPKLPAEEVQRQFTGLSNLDAFRQAIAFLRIARDFAQERGKLFGGPEQRVLDFGCGWGRITQLLLPFFSGCGDLRRGRRIVGQERKAELLRAYDGSDLSQREFARREGINFHTFVEWLHRRRRAPGTKPPPRLIKGVDVEAGS